MILLTKYFSKNEIQQSIEYLNDFVEGLYSPNSSTKEIIVSAGKVQTAIELLEQYEDGGYLCNILKDPFFTCKEQEVIAQHLSNIDFDKEVTDFIDAENEVIQGIDFTEEEYNEVIVGLDCVPFDEFIKNNIQIAKENNGTIEDAIFIANDAFHNLEEGQKIRSGL